MGRSICKAQTAKMSPMCIIAMCQILPTNGIWASSSPPARSRVLPPLPTPIVIKTLPGRQASRLHPETSGLALPLNAKPVAWPTTMPRTVLIPVSKYCDYCTSYSVAYRPVSISRQRRRQTLIVLTIRRHIFTYLFTVTRLLLRLPEPEGREMDAMSD
jgi:hypothetical protein